MGFEVEKAHPEGGAHGAGVLAQGLGGGLAEAHAAQVEPLLARITAHHRRVRMVGLLAQAEQLRLRAAHRDGH